jgi:hypothetical protein
MAARKTAGHVNYFCPNLREFTTFSQYLHDIFVIARYHSAKQGRGDDMKLYQVVIKDVMRRKRRVLYATLGVIIGTATVVGILNKDVLVCDRCGTRFKAKSGDGIDGACVDYPKASRYHMKSLAATW